MKILSLLLAGLLALATFKPTEAAAQNAPAWALSMFSPDATQITRVVTDANNATFVVGTTRGSATLGTFSVPVGGAQFFNGFVARLDAQGTVQWVYYLTAAGSGLETFVSGLALDAAGNVVFCGNYRNGGLTLGTVSLPANAANVAWSNGLVGKLDPAGNLLWAQAITEPNASLNATAAAVDAAGVAHVAVNTASIPFAGGLGLRSFSGAGTPGVRHDFPGVSGVAATSPLGVFSAITGLVVNPTTGQLGAVGEFQGTLTLRASGASPALTFSSPPEPQTGAFIASLDPTGAPQWAQQLTSTGITQNGRTGSFYNKLSGVAAVGNGFAVAGGYLGAGNIAGTVLPGTAAAGDPMAVLARFDGQGQVQWVRSVSGDGTADSGAVGTALATDAAGQLYMAGSCFGRLAANGGGLVSAGRVDAMVLRYSDQGLLMGAQREGSFGEERPSAIAIDPTGQPRLVGTIRGTCDFGGVQVASGASLNGFVARLSRTPLAARAATGLSASLQVFPNPSAGASGLQVGLLPGAAPATLRLLNTLGQQVRSQTVPARVAAATLPIDGLAPGHYVLQVVGADGVATRSVVVN